MATCKDAPEGACCGDVTPNGRCRALAQDRYERFEEADAAYQAELVRVYGRQAGDMRYRTGRHRDLRLIAARQERDLACAEWHAMRTAG